ncbi:espin-like [Amphibalanus amphitrite]|uniref:espin-like n=1 Tax=Amphibalanus amphitrite TaxID=1232801 RepID=UPI001C92A007|nr:espin-like [Amphibalanus amphitrite]
MPAVPFIPPKFPSLADPNQLIKPSEYLRSIGGRPIAPPGGRQTAPPSEQGAEDGPVSLSSDSGVDSIASSQPAPPPLPAIPEAAQEGGPPPPPPPPAPAAGPPLVAISASQLQQVQLRKTADKLTKTYSAPVGGATTANNNMLVKKDDVIAELKRSKDMDGVRKLREERAKSAVQILREESKEMSKEFTAEAFLSEIPETDAAGNTIPAWKRQMMARKAAERAKIAAEEQRLKDLEQQKMQALPPWKRQLIARKEEEDAKRRSMTSCRRVPMAAPTPEEMMKTRAAGPLAVHR